MSTFLKITLVVACLLALVPIGLWAQHKDPHDRDWAKFGRYEAANAEVKTRPVAVLLGDSITDNWAAWDPEWFQQHNYVGRGISGQVSSQMLVRFRADVLALHPDYVILLAGTNDIARNNGFITVEHVMGNLESIVELALLHGIKPVMCTVCPADRFGWYEAAGDPRPAIAQLNGLITAYAQARGIPLVDYHSALSTPDGALRPEYAKDSVHPSLDGYKVMEQVLQEVMDGLLAK